ncbi:hypothetical protein SCATT_17210 [Streptantibioticus cattleyicolor NRRL 8057 = DSM 46488]|uniref:Uncharacterized protein n=1 Tax=Streptantibioticus cattleyicolor (strain ATCC 35852 / DSM 46488 / JCM 4925 / NBRC 14057 / NRRL 8057) TaxID=1003195 RepID=G8WP59_STREN|nr:hypothetical protein SCATT_17210 [Streptantibioticus cattleyicolor NRRL 8057 = DSM 46488]
MRQCIATAAAPPEQLLVAILAEQSCVSTSDLKYATFDLRCELGLWHEGEHADHVWEWEDGMAPPLWARWTADGLLRFECLSWCEAPHLTRDEVCTLFQDHPREHSWNVADPRIEALRRRVLAEGAGWIPNRLD